jgi:hypothetical protein
MPAPPSSIEKWYRSHCNGDWEHQWGVSIETLDNPGWRIQIDLRQTQAEGRTSAWVKINRSGDDWLMYRAVGDKFEAACGPLNLSEALQVFTSWYDSPL